jgi:ABC-2 type transport system permease protein
VRSSAIAIGAMPLYAGLLGPPLIWMAIFSSPLWLSAIVFIPTLAFVATGVALLIVTGLFRLIGPRSTRVLAQIFSAVAGAIVFLTFQYFNVSSRGGDGMTPEQTAALIASLNIDPNAWWLFPAHAFAGDILPACYGSPCRRPVCSRRLHLQPQLRFRRSRRSRHGPQKTRGGCARRKGARGVMGSIIRKRVPPAAARSAVAVAGRPAIALLLPLGFVLLRPDPDGAFQLTPAAFAPALTLLAGALAGSLIWITVSAEDAPDLIASAPVHVRAVDRAKLFAAIAPVLALMVLPLLALSARDAMGGRVGCGWRHREARSRVR